MTASSETATAECLYIQPQTFFRPKSSLPKSRSNPGEPEAAGTETGEAAPDESLAATRTSWKRSTHVALKQHRHFPEKVYVVNAGEVPLVTSAKDLWADTF